LADYKSGYEDEEHLEKDEKELEKEEDESEQDEPGKYEPVGVVERRPARSGRKKKPVKRSGSKKSSSEAQFGPGGEVGRVRS
jgi:hypothetical protein